MSSSCACCCEQHALLLQALVTPRTALPAPQAEDPQWTAQARHCWRVMSRTQPHRQPPTQRTPTTRSSHDHKTGSGHLTVHQGVRKLGARRVEWRA